jgi:hypothetical protein
MIGLQSHRRFGLKYLERYSLKKLPASDSFFQMELPSLPVSRAYSDASSFDQPVESLGNILPDPAHFHVAIDTDFMLRELPRRTPQQVRPVPGITLPPAAPIVYDGFIGGGYSPPNSPGTPFGPAGFHYVQMGSDKLHRMVKKARTPPLPPKMRKSPPDPDSAGRSPRAATVCSQPAYKSEKQHEYISWKYMGDTDDICGCYSAKIRADTPRRLQSQTVAKFPADHARVRLRVERDPGTGRGSKVWKKLYRESLEPTLDKKPDMPIIRCARPDRVEGIDTDFSDRDIGRGFESRGKMVPIRASSLYAGIPRPDFT